MRLKISNMSASEARGVFLVMLGILALIYYYSWWFQEGRLTSLWLILGFIVAIFYGIFQLLASWLLYLWAHRRPQVTPPPPEYLTVDVFVTACGEPVEMVEQCLAAACAMRVAHSTWLLDDGQDPALAELAKRLGAGYLTRENRKDAKAGNVNAALTRTKGDIIAIFDVDHVPQPEFLQHSLGGFTDPAVGFVQVMPTFSNHSRGWVAKAATETSFDFYNPTSLGMDGFDSVTKMGSNSLIRRTALESIGGYQPGLAEDLATSIALHGVGWRSRYVAEPLAPGLSPPDLAAWFTQQFKWARGVFEVLLIDFPRLFTRLSWGSRMAYAVRTTKYLIGPIIFVHLSALIGVLLFGRQVHLDALQEYFIYLTPAAVMDVAIRHLALRRWHHPSVVIKSLWRAIVIVYASWPVYTLAWIMAILRLPLSFRPTPKNQANGVNPLWLFPQFITLFLLIGGVVDTISADEASGQHSLLYAVALFLAVPQLGLLRPLLRPYVTSIWDRLNQDSVNRDLPKISGDAPIKLAEFDVSRALNDIKNLEGYRVLKGLVRFHGTPLGYVNLPIIDGVCKASSIENAVQATFSSAIAKQSLINKLANFSHPEIQTLETPPAFDDPYPLVTVAVCTRNRANDLALCLASLSKLDYPNLEIIVVDNAPRDNATETLLTTHYPDVRYICEPRPGLNWARNRAAVEAGGDIIAYTDDDVVVDPDWIKNLAQLFTENPDVMAVTGLVVPYELETEPQILFECNGGFNKGFERKWYRVAQGEKMPWLYITGGQFGTGANMAYRRNLFDNIGYFDPALDVGTVTNGGGDLEMFVRTLKEGHTLVYDPGVIVRHRHRRSYEELKKQMRHNGSIISLLVCFAQRYPDELFSTVRAGLFWFQWLALLFLKSVLRLNKLPIDLIAAQLEFSLASFFRYKKAREIAAHILKTYGPNTPVVKKTPHSKAPDSKRTRETVGKRVELTQPILPLNDITDCASIRVHCTWFNTPLGSFDIENDYQTLSSMRLRQIIVERMGLEILAQLGRTDLNTQSETISSQREKFQRSPVTPAVVIDASQLNSAKFTSWTSTTTENSELYS